MASKADLAYEVFGIGRSDLTYQSITKKQAAETMKDYLTPVFNQYSDRQLLFYSDALALSSLLWSQTEWTWKMSAAAPIPYYFHLNMYPEKLYLPVFNAQDYDGQVQVISLTISRSHLPSADFAASKRLMKLPAYLASVLQLGAVVKKINAMYKKPVFKLRVLVDLALASRNLSKKYLSMLVSSVTHDFGAECWVYNSNSQIAVSNMLAFSTDTNKFKFNRQDLLDVLQLTRINHARLEELPLSMASATKPLAEFGLINADRVEKNQPGMFPTPQVIAFMPLSYSEEIQLKGANNDMEVKTKVDSKPTSKSVSTSAKQVSSTTSSSPSSHQDRPHKLSQSSPNAFHDLKNRDLFDYSTNASVTDVIRRHTRKSRIFNPNVVIIKAGKPKDDQQDKKGEKE